MNPEEIKIGKISLRANQAPLADINARMRQIFPKIAGRIRPGMRIAVAVGSRGIYQIDRIVRSLVELLAQAGAVVYIVPAMGSHGGATGEGQAEILADYGINQATMGVPVRSSMQVITLGSTGGTPDLPVYMDREASLADQVIVVNRVKAHTDYHGRHESGLIKMMAIGLGKQAQANVLHRYGAAGLREHIPRVAQCMVASGKILAGLAILEDGGDQTADLEFALGEEIFALDAEFLLRSKQLMPRLPFDQVDVLIIDEMGKDISGTGMDTNIIGRLCIRGEKDGLPDCTRIAVLRLTPGSHGNAIGIGLADITTRCLVGQIDWNATRTNVMTSGFLERSFLPFVADSDRQAVEIALANCWRQDVAEVRLARIRNTLHLDEIYVSPALYRTIAPQLLRQESISYENLGFDKDGNIDPF